MKVRRSPDTYIFISIDSRSQTEFRYLLLPDCYIGIGIVQEIGENCKALRIGDRVGWGYTYWSCGRCSACLTGHESYCPTAGKYGAHHLDQGSFGNLAIKSEQWVFKIPDGIESKYAAPLLCTLLFSCIRLWA